jgi:hypothetical protein
MKKTGVQKYRETVPLSAALHLALIGQVGCTCLATKENLSKTKCFFWTCRRSLAKSYLRFAYSLVSFMMHQYYLCCDFYFTYRQIATNIKQNVKFSNFRLALRMYPALPKEAANMSRFA